MRQLTVGESVYTARYNGYGTAYTDSKVVKVTPSGMVDVSANGSTYVTRFNKDGNEVGRDKFRSSQIDETPYAERAALIAQDVRRRAAACAVKNIKAAEVNVLYVDSDSLRAEIARMRTELDAAMALVETI